MEKQAIRERVWDDLEESGVARFPFPPHDRIPNFAGADEAAERVFDLDAWAAADTVKANPDAPQLPVRRGALRQGKTLYMAVPRLRDEECFLRLDPDEVEDVEHATTVGGSAEAGVPVHPEEMPAIDLVVSGSVAVTPAGARVGKGEGYSDLEFGVLREFGLVDDATTTVTSVHDRQVLDVDVPTTQLDVPMDWVCTPDRTIETASAAEKPTGIDWDAIDAQRRQEIPILDAIAPE
jgi:5-formyltetrahydrofolate cyclo-ligase